MLLRATLSVFIVAIALLECKCSTPQWTQDRFAISFWVDPMVPAAEFEQRYKEIAGANFTVLLGGFGATNREDVAACLEACEKVGLKAIPAICEDPDGTPHAGGSARDLQSPALWGLQMKDEPNVGEFKQLANWSASINKERPELLRFINLLPNYATASQVGAATYGDYVKQYIETVHPQFLCMDHYPFFDGSPGRSNATKEGYRANLEVLQFYSLQARIPFWNFFNSLAFGSHYNPTESEIRWQVFTSLAYGAKGVLYFCYWTPPGGFLDGIIRPQARPGSTDIVYARGEHYEQARRINSLLLIYGNLLVNAEVKSTFYGNGTSGTSVHLPPGRIIAEVNDTRAGNGFEFLVSEFSLPDARVAVLVQNQKEARSLWATLVFAPFVQPSTMTIINMINAQEDPLMDESPMDPGIQIGIEAGGARLLISKAS